MYPSMKIALILAATIGFVAGKVDADQRIRSAIERQNERIATINARALVREINAASKVSDAS